MHRLLRALLAIVAALLGFLVLSVGVSAAAPTRNGTCDSGEVCFYYNSNQAGSISDMGYSLANYGTGSSCNHFLGAGSGSGLCLKNNAASVWNRTTQTVRVDLNSGFAGPHQDFAAGARGNLNATLKNQNASHQLLPAAPERGANGCLKNGPQNFGAYLSGSTCPPANFPYLPTIKQNHGVTVAQDPYGDGCSGLGWNAQDKVFEFTDACMLHDFGWDLVRWRSPGISKLDVDNYFQTIMNNDCAPRGWAAEKACRAMASGYASTVRAWPLDGGVQSADGIRYP